MQALIPYQDALYEQAASALRARQGSRARKQPPSNPAIQAQPPPRQCSQRRALLAAEQLLPSRLFVAERPIVAAQAMTSSPSPALKLAKSLAWRLPAAALELILLPGRAILSANFRAGPRRAAARAMTPEKLAARFAGELPRAAARELTPEMLAAHSEMTAARSDFALPPAAVREDE